MAEQLQNCFVSGQYLLAREVADYLKAKGCTVKLVQRFAVQVFPDSVEKAEEAIWNFEAGWRGDDRYEKARVK